MGILGKRIKALRTAAGLTQQQLANELQISVQSVHRYETMECSVAQSILIQLATYFDVSVDYLLGLVSFEKQMEEEKYKILLNGKYNSFYKQYLECKNNSNIETGSTYYWIYISKENHIGGQTEWAGWANDQHTLEIRKLRQVDPPKAILACTELYGRPLTINKVEDVAIFYLVGGQAIVKTDICEKYMTEFCKDYIVKKTAH